MHKEKLMKEIRIKTSELSVRDDGGSNEGKMIVEGYPIVFEKEAFIGEGNRGWWEKIDRHAFDNADMSDVCLKYNHNDNFFILARTRNKSLTLTPDDHGVFIHAELIDTSENRDVYKMIRAKLLTEGSFAFTASDEKEEIINGEPHRTIMEIGTLFDIAVCVNGAYGDLTELYARSRELVETKLNRSEDLGKVQRIRLVNVNKLKLLGGKKENDNQRISK